MELTVESLVFVLFSLITLGSGLLVVSTRNLFHAALYLMLSLFGVAGLFVLLTAPFLAGVQVVVYIGAIAILIIFAIMLTPQVMQVTNVRNEQWVAGIVVSVLVFIVLMLVVTPLGDDLGLDSLNAGFTQEDPAPVPQDNIEELGTSLVDTERYVLPFEVASVLLMAALIGAVMLVGPAELLRRDAAPAVEPGTDQAG